MQRVQIPRFTTVGENMGESEKGKIENLGCSTRACRHPTGEENAHPAEMMFSSSSPQNTSLHREKSSTLESKLCH